MRGKSNAWEEDFMGVGGPVFMLLQICRDYSTLPNPLALDVSEIKLFYDGLRAELLRTSDGR